MKLSFEELQEALICEMITVDQFIEVIIDNFGYEKGSEIIFHNLQLALNSDFKDYRDDAGMLNCGSTSASAF